MKKSTITPIGYGHQYESMRRYAEHLNLSGLADRSCESYYRQIRLIGEHFDCDPAKVNGSCFVHIKCVKQWAPKTIRQALVAESILQ